MANPNWKPGCVSPNPEGRKKKDPRHRSIKRSVELFIKRNYSPHKLQALHNKLNEKEKLQLFTELAPYVMPKLSAIGIRAHIEGAGDATVEELYEMLTGGTADDFLASLTAEPKQLPEPIKAAV